MATPRKTEAAAPMPDRVEQAMRASFMDVGGNAAEVGAILRMADQGNERARTTASVMGQHLSSIHRHALIDCVDRLLRSPAEITNGV